MGFDGLTPGIFPNVPREEYHAAAGVSFDKLRHLEPTPLHAQHALLAPDEPTEAMEFGTLVHTAVLEPEQLDARYAVGPQVDRRYTVGKKQWAEFLAANVGRETVSIEDLDAARAITKAVHANETAHVLLAERGVSELSLCWKDEPTGLMCRGRIDRASSAPAPFLIDLKSAKHADVEFFRKEVHNRRYHVQAAHYLEGANVLSPLERRWAWIVVETSPPYAVACYELEADALDEGRRIWRRWLDQWAQCMESHVWPGYPAGLTPLSLPHWAFRGE